MPTLMVHNKWKFDEKFNQVLNEDGATIVLLFGKTATKSDKIVVTSALELLDALEEMILNFGFNSKTSDLEKFECIRKAQVIIDNQKNKNDD